MANIKLPLFYQPNQVIFLDDNINFLKTLTLLLPNDLHFKNFSAPKACLEYLKNHFSTAEKEPRKKLFVNSNEDENSIELQFDEIHKQVYNHNRFQHITVCVTDYTMPIMNGIEFCEAIAELKCQKILLTGDAGYDLAVHAFNTGTIDKFILKDSVDYTNQIISAISEQQLNYFIELTEHLLGSQFEANPHQLTFLLNSEVKHYFDQACETKNIVEYYLLDAHGSYLLLDIYGKPTWFLMKDEKNMQEFQEVAEFDKAPQEIFQKLKNRSHLPFFFSEADFQTPIHHWHSFMHPIIKKINTSDTTFYISILHEENSPYKFKKPIFTYQNFLES